MTKTLRTTRKILKKMARKQQVTVSTIEKNEGSRPNDVLVEYLISKSPSAR